MNNETFFEDRSMTVDLVAEVGWQYGQHVDVSHHPFTIRLSDAINAIAGTSDRKTVAISYDAVRSALFGMMQKHVSELNSECVRLRGFPTNSVSINDESIREILLALTDRCLVESAKQNNEEVWKLTKQCRRLLSKDRTE